MARRSARTPPPPPSGPDDIEAAFYDAMQAGDLERLMACWADDEDVVCVHPGGQRLIGPSAIRAAFEAVFASGRIEVSLQHVRRIQSMGAAVHNVLEKVKLHGEKAEAEGWVIATNVYQQTPEGWRMVLHHASPGNTDEPEELESSIHLLH